MEYHGAMDLSSGMGLLPYGIRPNEVRNLRVRILRVDPRVGKEPANKKESSYSAWESVDSSNELLPFRSTCLAAWKALLTLTRLP